MNGPLFLDRRAPSRGMRAAAVLVPFSLSLVALSGCFASAPLAVDPAAVESWLPADVAWDMEGPMSVPLEKGPFGVLPVKVATFDSFDGTRMSTSVWLPDVPEGQKVPVLIDIGPYFGDSIEEALYDFEHLMLEGLVPHGFAYAQVAVRGTSSSGGCMEMFSINEQVDIDEAVTYFATQPWSNGNVALTGLSYDGTTTWIGATFDNPHLKTIIPISGLTSIYHHGFRNGTAWVASLALHPIYWSDGFTTEDRTPQDKVENVACPEYPEGQSTAVWSTVTGEPATAPPFTGYWEERDFRGRILENYQGSVFLVQGLQDWRVPAHMAFPFMDDLQAKGLETKMLMGQWPHDFADTVEREDASVRFDYGEVLLRWLTKYLKGDASVNTGPAVDVQDSRGLWRSEEDWPPPDATWMTLHLGDGALSADKTAAGEAVLYGPANARGLAAQETGTDAAFAEYLATTGPLDADLRVAGLPQLHVTFVPTSPEGSHVYAQLLDRSPDGTVESIGHAVMDLRYHAGGEKRDRLTPGSAVVAQMEFFPLDVYVERGHELLLRIVGGSGYAEQRPDQIDWFHESPTPFPVRLQWGDGTSVLKLAVVQRDVGDGKYPGQP